MRGSIDITLILAEVAFWFTLEAGVYTAAIRKGVAVLFVALWVFGRLGLPYVVPAEDLLVPYLVVIELALLLTMLTREIALSDGRAE
jgi:hypothetical protein